MSEEIQGFHLSPLQEHLWALAAAGEAASVQGILAVRGHLDRDRLSGAWATVASRHGILRTSFHRRPGFKTVLQAVSDRVEVPEIAVTDMSSLPAREARQRLAALAAAERSRPWDLESRPLVRLHLATLEEGEHRLLVTLPTLAADLRTLDTLATELAAALAGGSFAEEEPVAFVELAAWQRSLLEEEGADEGVSWWRQGERNRPRSLELPFAPSAGEAAAEGRWERVEVSLPASADRDFCLACWFALLGRLHGQGEPAEVSVGVVVDARRFEDLEGVLGPASRAVPVSVDVSEQTPFRDLVSLVAEARREAEEWQDFYPGSGDDAFRAGFTWLDRSPAAAGDVGVVVAEAVGTPEPFPLALQCLDGGDGVGAQLVFDPGLHQRALVETLADQLSALAADAAGNAAGNATGNGSAPVGRLELLGEAERRRLVDEFNDTAADWGAEPTAAAVLAAASAAAPDRVALRWTDSASRRELTNRELRQRVVALARRLSGSGVGRGATVALLAERAPETVVGLLAVLEAGAAFAPLDPAQPDERLGILFDELDPALVLTGGVEAERAARLVGERPALDLAGAMEAATGGGEAGHPGAGPDDLAYVLFTSGSTGRPKGVMVPHRALVDYLEWCRRHYGLEGGGTALLHSALSFDLTLTSLLAPLAAGGTVELVPEGRGIEELAAALSGRRVDLLKLTPSHLEALAGRVDGGSAALLVVGGEALRGEALAAWRGSDREARVVNEYGPTEASVGCTLHEVPAGVPAPGPVPIGRPLANARIYVVGRGGKPVPVGVAGELLIGGVGLARGYLGRPAETALRFVPDALSGAAGERLYRSGDLARFRPDGELEFLGRLDDQVKVRGFRVEPGEVEAALEAHPAVERAVVALRGDRLTAWLVAADGEPPKVEEMLRFLADRLPEPMLPGAFAWLDELPLTSHGKVDRRALPEPDGDRPDLEGEYVAPSTPLQEVLVSAWSEALGVDRIGVRDNFFSLGGDSIRSVRVVALAQERGLDFTVQDLFRHRTIEALAAFLESRLGLVEEDLPLSDEELVAALEEVEGLSEEAVRSRLREQSAVERSEA